MTIKRYREFHLNESQSKSLWRTSSIDWLLDLLQHKRVQGRPYVSMSHARLSGAEEAEASDGYDYGSVTVELDQDAVYAQGAQDIVYTEEWFDKHPDLAKYVLGWKEAPTQEDKDEFNADHKNNSKARSWEEHVRGFSPEQEVVLKTLTYRKGLLKGITVWPDETPQDEDKIALAERLSGLKAARKDKPADKPAPKTIYYSGYTPSEKERAEGRRKYGPDTVFAQYK